MFHNWGVDPSRINASLVGIIGLKEQFSGRRSILI
jgi:hypothetical protein